MINWREPAIHLLDAVTIRHGIGAKLRELRRFDGLSPERQLGIQQDRLVALLDHAARHVPYYRDVLQRSGVFHPGGIDLPRFGEIPFLTKEILRARYDDLKSDDLSRRDWFKNSSGGSTGEPVTFLQDRDYAAMGMARAYRENELLGAGRGEPLVKLWGSERDILQGSLGWKVRIVNFVKNIVYLNAFRMDREAMARYAEVIRRRPPSNIEAYAESAYELARFIRENGLEMPSGGSLTTSAGTLYDFMREEISGAFHRPVFNRYGSREVGAIAMDLPSQEGMAVNLHGQVVEVLNDRLEPCAPGEEGEIVVTCLSNFSMPLIRFRIGDTGAPLRQARSPFPQVTALKTVTGRTVDNFVTADGALVNGEYFTHLLYFRPWVKKFQFLQVDPLRIEVRIVRTPGAEAPRRELDDIAAQMKVVMGQACATEFVFTNEIPPGASGKYRYTVSRVSRPLRPEGPAEG